MKEVNREFAIDKLIDNEIDSIRQLLFYNDASYIADIFREGHKGYANFTNEELEIELYEQLGQKHKII